MALVVLLRGVNVGGHRTFRPTALVAQLQHLGIVNIGAAGTFVVRQAVPRAKLRAEIALCLPFEAEIVICEGRDLVRLLSHEAVVANPPRPGIVRFVSVLARTPRSMPPLPLSFPSTGTWLVRIVAREHRFLIGEYRRDIRAIGYLGTLDRVFGVPVTTRNWNTLGAIAKALERGGI